MRKFSLTIVLSGLLWSIPAHSDEKISQMPAPVTLTGTELVPIVQNNNGVLGNFAATLNLIRTFAINSTVANGVAKMTPFLNQSSLPNTAPWQALDPFGNAISCAGTTTQCLQEFMNVTAANGWPAEVDCQGTLFPSHTEPVFIEATTSVNVPVAQDWSFRARGCNLNFNVATIPGLIFDSQGASRFYWDGKIVYNVTAPSTSTTGNGSCAVVIKPTTNTADGFPGLYAGQLYIGNPVSAPSGGSALGVVCMDLSIGSIIEQNLQFDEINGSNTTQYGIVSYRPAAATGLQQSFITVSQIHGTSVAGAAESILVTNATNNNGNLWRIAANNTFAGRGVDTWGTNDIWDIGLINGVQGSLNIGIVTEVSAANNQFRCGAVNGAVTQPVLDTGTHNYTSGCGLPGQMPGTVTNDSANAGNIGEYITSSVNSPGVNLSNAIAANVASVALTAGDWDVCGVVDFYPAGSTTITSVLSWISTVSAATPSATTPNAGAWATIAATLGTGQVQRLPTGCMQQLLASPTTVFLEAQSAFATSTMTAGGFIGARRRR